MSLDPIDSLRFMLIDKFNAICCVLSIIAMSVFLVFIVLVIAVDRVLDRLPVP